MELAGSNRLPRPRKWGGVGGVKINELQLYLVILSVYFATAKIQKFHKTGTYSSSLPAPSRKEN